MFSFAKMLVFCIWGFILGWQLPPCVLHVDTLPCIQAWKNMACSIIFRKKYIVDYSVNLKCEYVIMNV